MGVQEQWSVLQEVLLLLDWREALVGNGQGGGPHSPPLLPLSQAEPGFPCSLAEVRQEQQSWSYPAPGAVINSGGSEQGRGGIRGRGEGMWHSVQSRGEGNYYLIWKL